MRTQIRIVRDPHDGSTHVVADAVAAGEELAFPEAPQPYHSVARYWFVATPFNQQPWNQYKLDLPKPAQDEKLKQFQIVQGVFPSQRRAWVNAGGDKMLYFNARDKYKQDLERFLGIVEHPSDSLTGKLEEHDAGFKEYGMGTPGVFRMLRSDADENNNRVDRVITCLFFPETTLPASLEAMFHYRAEDIEDDESFEFSSIVTGYHWRLVRAGIHVEKLHPQAPLPLQALNQALKDFPSEN